eukprot:6903971-Prymnesium_polylepis.1
MPSENKKEKDSVNLGALQLPQFALIVTERHALAPRRATPRATQRRRVLAVVRHRAVRVAHARRLVDVQQPSPQVRRHGAHLRGSPGVDEDDLSGRRRMLIVAP